MDFKEEAKRLLKAQDFDELLKLSEQEILDNPDNIEGYRFKSYCLEDYDEKKKCIDKILELNPKDFETHEEKAQNIFHRNKNIKETIDYLDNVISKYPDEAQAYITKAVTLDYLDIFLSDSDEKISTTIVEEACLKGLELGYKGIEPYNILGDIYSKQDYEKAKEYYEKALKFDENDYSANYGILNCIKETQGLVEGMEYCDKLINRDPNNTDFYELKFNLITDSVTLLDSDEIKEMIKDEVIELFNKLKELNPQENDYYTEMGSFYYYTLDDKEAAKEIYKEAIEKFEDEREDFENYLKDMEECSKKDEKNSFKLFENESKYYVFGTIAFIIIILILIFIK